MNSLTFAIPTISLYKSNFGHDLLIPKVQVYRNGEFLKDAVFNERLLEALVGQVVKVGTSGIRHDRVQYRAKRWTLTDKGILLHMVTRYENLIYKGHQKLNQATIAEIMTYGHLFIDCQTPAEILAEMQQKNPYLKSLIRSLDLTLITQIEAPALT
jgi:hypothetical protein